MLRAILSPILFCLMFLSAQAQEDPRIARLYEALAMPDVLVIMRQEGLEYGRELAQELFDGGNSASWKALVSEIYDLPRLERIVKTELVRDLASADLDPMVAFFESDLGARIIGLELSARTAMLAPEIEEMARETLAELIRTDAPRLDMLTAFSEANQLIENNVVGALNSNYSFYVGLSEGGAFGAAFAEADILADVWSQEDAIRDQTVDWLMSYIALAYQPLSDEDLAAYVAFSRTAPGVALNRAIFDAFDAMYTEVSMALGAAAAGFIAGEEL